MLKSFQDENVCEALGNETYLIKKPIFKNFIKERFILNPSTELKLRSMKPEFGYNGFGEFLFYRTYSRKEEGKNQENWADCIVRVINGVFSILKDWHVRSNLRWDEERYQKQAEEMAISAFKMEWLPPGRGLFSMGTDYVYERGSTALFNCSFTNLKNLPEDIAWMMDSLMNGVGVGYNVEDKWDFVINHPTNRKIKIIIDDSREGWCLATKILLQSYLIDNHPTVEFDYSKIRIKGLPIKGYGGLSSGPEPLMWLHDKIREFSDRLIKDQNYSTTKYKADIANCVGCCVVAGNVRRSALMCLGDINNSDFMNLKDYKLNPYREEFGWMSNNSCKLKKSEDFEKMGEIAKRVIERGEPGYLNLINTKFGRLRIRKSDDTEKYGRELELDESEGINPCFTGDTNVAVADGRNMITFEQLVKENKDVPVYCRNDKNQIVIRYMRNPRKTGESLKVFRINLDDGSFIRATENHKFKLRNGDYKEVKDLIAGDSLEIMTKFIASMKEAIGGNGSNSDYMWLNNGQRSNMTEHRKIAEFFIGKIQGKIIHHKDNNSLNNDFINLEILDKDVHDKLHKEKMNMFNNPMCQEHDEEWWTNFHKNMSKAVSGMLNGRAYKISHEELIEKMKNYIISIKRCPTQEEWKIYAKANNLPPKLERFRYVELGSTGEVLAKLATELGFYNRSFDKICVVCGKSFIGYTNTSKRCSVDCRKINMHEMSYNHKVVSIEFDSYQDVYNGTVDEFHNYYVGGFKTKTKSDKDKFVFVNVKNCGEVPLSDKEMCNLAHTFPTRCEAIDNWFKACQRAAFYCSTVYMLPTHSQETNSVMLRNRKIGVSIAGFAQWKHEYGVSKITRFLRDGYALIRKTNKTFAKEYGVPESLRVTTIQPGGTVPKLPGVESGIGHPNFHEQIRRVRIAKDNPICKFLIEANVPHESDKFSFNTEIFEFVIKQGPTRPAIEVSLWEQAMNLVLVQREWADAAISNTLNFRPKWKLHKILDRKLNSDRECDEYIDRFMEYWGSKGKYETTDNEIKVYTYNENHEEDDIEAVLSAIAPMTKSVSLLPHSDHGAYVQMPEQGISAEEYERRLNQIKIIDWSKYQGGDGTDEKFCTGEKCEVKLKS